MALSFEPRILSAPCDVFWAGFKSDTYKLQQGGWSISVEQAVADRGIRLLMNHRQMRLYAISEYSEFDYYRNAQSRGMAPTFNVTHVASRIEVLRIHDRLDNFKLIDAAPQIVNSEITSIEDFGIFAVPMVRTEEIIVDPKDVSAMLEQIRAMQSTEQRNIRERNVSRDRRDAVPEQIFHAQILSFNKAA
jgi:hypothetical protein